MLLLLLLLLLLLSNRTSSTLFGKQYNIKINNYCILTTSSS